MIKISFFSTNGIDDVCEILESKLTNDITVEDWLIVQIPSLQFDCMDYPHDLEAFYDCYFKTNDDELTCKELYCLLDSKLKFIEQVNFSIETVDLYIEDI